MYRDTRKSAGGEKKDARSRKSKYLPVDPKDEEQERIIDATPTESDHGDDDSDDKPVHANSAKLERKKKKRNNETGTKGPVLDMCVEAQPLPARLASVLDTPLGYAQSVRYGKEVTLSGIWAYGRNGLLVADDDDSLPLKERAHAQTKQVFRNVHEALVAAGCRGLEDITSMVVSLVDVAATAEPFFQERAKIMGDNVEYTSSVVGITGFPVPGGLVHVDVAAVIGRGWPIARDGPDALVKGDKAKAVRPGGVNTSGRVVAYPRPSHTETNSQTAIAVRYGKEVTLGGIWAYTDRSRLVRGGAREQTRQVLKNVHAALVEAGCRGFEDVTSIKASLVDIEDTWEIFVQERDRVLAPNHEYTSSIVGVAALPGEGALVHVDVEAVVGRGCLLGGGVNNTRA